jgi:hypothetical protein
MAFVSPELDAIILGGAGAIPTTALWTEIRALIQNAYGMVVGSVTLAGPSGATVTIADLGVVEYDVVYWIEYNSGLPAGNIGEIRIEIVSSTSFKVYNSGSDASSVLYYRIVKR